MVNILTLSLFKKINSQCFDKKQLSDFIRSTNKFSVKIVSEIVTKNISILFTRWPHIFHVTTLSVNKSVSQAAR